MDQIRGVCLRCAFRYFNFNGICKVVSDQCSSWNQNTGACTSCYGGYRLSDFSCVIDNQPYISSSSSLITSTYSNNRITKPVISVPVVSSSINIIKSNK